MEFESVWRFDENFLPFWLGFSFLGVEGKFIPYKRSNLILLFHQGIYIDTLYIEDMTVNGFVVFSQ